MTVYRLVVESAQPVRYRPRFFLGSHHFTAACACKETTALPLA